MAVEELLADVAEFFTEVNICRYVLSLVEYMLTSSGGGTGGLGGAQPPMKKVGGLKVCLAPPPQYLPSAPRSGDRWENFEVGAEHILDREVPFPAIWVLVCKAKKIFVRSAPTDGGAPLR